MPGKYSRTSVVNVSRGDCFFAVTAVTLVTTLISRSYLRNGSILVTRYARYTIDFSGFLKTAPVRDRLT
jgi:hypothetical protein